jgi:flagellar biosynthetic protein FliR
MSELAALTSRHLETFLLAFFRLSGLLLVAPVLGHRSVPVPHRAGLAALTALLVAPLLAPPAGGRDRDALALALAVGGELLVGAAIGLVAALVVGAVQVAGELVGHQMGLGIAALFDPAAGGQMTVVTRFQDHLALLLILALNGHHLLLQAVAASFQRIPPGGVGLTGALPATVVGLGGKLFRSGLELAAPVVGVLVVVNLVLALLTRVAPHANIFAVGLPVTVAAGLAGLVETFPYFAAVLARLTAGLAADLTLVLQGAARGTP